MVEEKEATKPTASAIDRMKREAKAMRKAHGVPHHAALEQVAKDNGYASWRAVTQAAAAVQATAGATPPVGTPGLKGLRGNSPPAAAPVAGVWKSERVGERGPAK